MCLRTVAMNPFIFFPTFLLYCFSLCGCWKFGAGLIFGSYVLSQKTFLRFICCAFVSGISQPFCEPGQFLCRMLSRRAGATRSNLVNQSSLEVLSEYFARLSSRSMLHSSSMDTAPSLWNDAYGPSGSPRRTYFYG